MKAAVLERIDAPLTVAEVELGPLGAGHVLVKVLVSGICGSQLQEIAGNKGNAKFVPHLLGHEGCGIVEEIGAGVTTVKKGDKVVLHWRKGDGIESDFPSYIYRGSEMRSGKVTTFSEYTIVSENRVTKVPHDVPDDLCALLGCGLSTALSTIEKEAKVAPNESVLVVGLGGLGASFVLASSLAGAKIIAADIHDKHDAAHQLGAHRFVNVAKEDLSSALESEQIKNVDVIIETTGSAKSIERVLPLLGGGGRCILVGQPKPGESVEMVNAHHLFDGEGKTIKATQGGQFSPADDIPRYIQLYREGNLPFERLVTHRTSLDSINNAITLMREGKANRIMIDV